jgi:hypothetical protein
MTSTKTTWRVFPRGSTSSTITNLDNERLPFEAEARLNINKEFSPYIKKNTTVHHYSDQFIDAV